MAGGVSPALREAVRRANNTFYGLAAAIWTRDVKKAHHLAARIRAGTIWVNCYHQFDAAPPFGGFKMSGHGRELNGLSQSEEEKGGQVQFVRSTLRAVPANWT